MVDSTTEDEHAAVKRAPMKNPLALAERDGILMLLVAGLNILLYAKWLIGPYIEQLDKNSLSADLPLHCVMALTLLLSIPLRIILGLGLLNDAPWARSGAIYSMLAGYFADIWLLYWFISTSVSSALEADRAHILGLIAIIYGAVVLLYLTWRVVYDLSRPAIVQAFAEADAPPLVPLLRDADSVPSAIKEAETAPQPETETPPHD